MHANTHMFPPLINGRARESRAAKNTPVRKCVRLCACASIYTCINWGNIYHVSVDMILYRPHATLVLEDVHWQVRQLT